jgi:hypothetical protein
MTSPLATCMCTRAYHDQLPWRRWVRERWLGGRQRNSFVKAPLFLIWWKLVRWRRLSGQICCDRVGSLAITWLSEHIYTLNKKKTITTQREDPSDLLLRMLRESNSKNYGQEVTCDVPLMVMLAFAARNASYPDWNKRSYVIHDLPRRWRTVRENWSWWSSKWQVNNRV